MGRLPKEIDMVKLLEMAENEAPPKEMAQELGISIPTLKNRIDALRTDQGVLLDAKSVENLRVIKMKDVVLTRLEKDIDRMEPDELVRALSVLNKMDVPDTRAEKLTGLMGLIAEIDKEAEIRAEEIVEEKELMKKTVDITPKSKQFPNL